MHDWSLAQEPLMLDDAQINDSVTDTSTAVHLVKGWIGEGTKWDVL